MSPENQKPDLKTTLPKPLRYQNLFPKPPQTLKCPRCNSSNTKFCYYNNYNLSQPRHSCKTCRRYWTHGGTLRDIPVGGRVRKPGHRKLKPNLITPTCGNCGGSGLARDRGHDEVGFELHPATAGVYTQFVNGPGPGPGFGLDLLRMNSNLINNNNNNEEMLWKFEQQRLLWSFIYGPSFNIINKENNNINDNNDKNIINDNNNIIEDDNNYDEKMGIGEINGLFDNLHGV